MGRRPSLSLLEPPHPQPLSSCPRTFASGADCLVGCRRWEGGRGVLGWTLGRRGQVRNVTYTRTFLPILPEPKEGVPPPEWGHWGYGCRGCSLHSLGRLCQRSGEERGSETLGSSPWGQLSSSWPQTGQTRSGGSWSPADDGEVEDTGQHGARGLGCPVSVVGVWVCGSGLSPQGWVGWEGASGGGCGAQEGPRGWGW